MLLDPLQEVEGSGVGLVRGHGVASSRRDQFGGSIQGLVAVRENQPGGVQSLASSSRNSWVRAHVLGAPPRSCKEAVGSVGGGILTIVS